MKRSFLLTNFIAQRNHSFVSYYLGRTLAVFALLVLTALMGSGIYAQCNVQALTGVETTGNQNYPDRLGMNFTVNTPIMVTQLGAFDSNQDGLLSPIDVGIVRTDGVVVVAPINMSGSSDALSGNHRMRTISPVILQPGSYVIVAVGYSNVERNGNVTAGNMAVTLNTGGGQITPTGASYGGSGFGLPTTPWPNADVFHAGTFRFSSLIPALQVTVNGIQLTNNNDGSDESEDLIVCNTTANNLFFTQFSDISTISPKTLVKVEQTFTKTNSIFTPADGVYPLSGYGTPFDRNVSLINPASNGGLDMYFRAFYDSNDNNILDGNECPSDYIAYIVDVNDYEPPSINCPSNVTVSTSTGANTDQEPGDCGAVVRGINADPATDNCPSPTINYSISGATMANGNGDASGNFFYTGVNTVVYRIFDHGVPVNKDTCVFTVTVEDDEIPTILCPQNVTIGTDPGECSALYNYDVEYDDNCYGVNAMGFADEFEPGNWTISNSNGGNGFVDESDAPNSIIITGSELGPISPSNNTDYCITIPGDYGGTLAFDWDYNTSDDDGPFYDKFGYVVDGVFTQLTNDAGSTTQNGLVSIMLMPGQTFCFRILSTDQAFGSAVTIAMSFTYMESINPTVAQNAGLASGAVFPLGTTTNTFTVTDNNDNTASCSFTVTVEDTEDPTIECPDDIVVPLKPLECEAEIVFDATAADNCPGVTYEVSTDLESGDLFPIGVNEVVFVATDNAGNTASCSFTVTIVDYFNSSLGCINRHVSLDENCTAVIDPYMVLTGYENEFGDTLLGCIDSFYVNVKDAHGNDLGNTVDGENLGKTLDYVISNPSHGFYCWGTLKIEDKFRPHVVCTNDTLSCVEPLSNAILPDFVDNCPGGKLILLSEVQENLNCNDDFLKKITKVWSGVDKYGNLADTCTQLIYIERTDLSGISFPGHFTGTDALLCRSFTPDANGFPPVSVTGVPKLKGVNLYPFNQAAICNGFVAYSDKWTFTSDCKKIFTRTWEVGEWWCNSTNIQTWVQTIEIKDKEAPVIAPIADITVSTGSNSCTAAVNLPAASISDKCNTWTVKINTGEGVLNTNGGTATLTAGIHSVSYTATDLCGNQSTRSMRVTVIDRVEPIAVCETRTVISLKEDGTAWLHKTTIDDGSFDECGPIELKIRRMATTCDQVGTQWSDDVLFCCADVGKENMVVLQVTDQVGRTNQCMVTVEVQDKRIPTLTCPADVVVECTTPFDVNDLSASFGYPIVGGGGCADVDDVDENVVDQINNCRVGNLIRNFTLTHNNQLVGSCSQIVKFVPDRPFTSNMIKWPRDTTFINSFCTAFDLDPENLPAGYGAPNIDGEGVCDLVASSHEDDKFYFTSNGACLKIVRRWTVINWCVRRTDGTIWQESRDQVIVIMNTKAPVIKSPTTRREVCSYNADCTPVSIKLTAAADDDCTPNNELRWRWTITLENGNKLYGTGNDASGIYPFGSHRVDFEVEDKCGNINYTGYPFDVKSCKPPVAYCKQGLSTGLVAMDTDGNGILDAEMSILTPSFFDNGSYQSCGNSIRLSFSADVEDDTLVLSCDDIGLYQVELWVTDENGNQGYCITFVDVQDNNNVNICPPGIVESDIYGRIHTSDDKGIENVTVKLLAAEESIGNTEDSGKYSFDNKTKGKAYDVLPVKSDDYLNGVSTLDLVMIQRHILGVSKLNSPYKLIAADVTQDDKISASDLVTLRKLILGTTTSMPNGKSWRFFWDGHIFADPANPWAADMGEMYNIAKLTGDMAIDFTGVKLGDIDGNAVANIQQSLSENRSGEKFELWYKDQMVNAGETISIPVYASNSALIHGVQWKLFTNGLDIRSMSSAELNVTPQEYVVLSDNTLKLSMAVPYGKVVGADQTLFVIEAVATQSGKLSEMMLLDDNFGAEVYTGEKISTMDIAIRSRELAKADAFAADQIKPNPWSESSVLTVQLPQTGLLKLVVRDAAGKLVVSKSMQMQAGKHNLELTREMIQHSGVYIYNIEFGGETKQGKMIVLD